MKHRRSKAESGRCCLIRRTQWTTASKITYDIVSKSVATFRNEERRCNQETGSLNTLLSQTENLQRSVGGGGSRCKFTNHYDPQVELELRACLKFSADQPSIFVPELKSQCATHVCSSGSGHGVVSIGHSVLSRLWLGLRLRLRLRLRLKLGLSLGRDLGALWLAGDIDACAGSSLANDTAAAALNAHDILLRA